MMNRFTFYTLSLALLLACAVVARGGSPPMPNNDDIISTRAIFWTDDNTTGMITFRRGNGSIRATTGTLRGAVSK